MEGHLLNPETFIYLSWYINAIKIITVERLQSCNIPFYLCLFQNPGIEDNHFFKRAQRTIFATIHFSIQAIQIPIVTGGHIKKHASVKDTFLMFIFNLRGFNLETVQVNKNIMKPLDFCLPTVSRRMSRTNRSKVGVLFLLRCLDMQLG